MSFRRWLSVITVVILGLVIVLAWDEIERAVGYLGRVNLWILALMIPVQLLSYFATGEMLFSYLRSKGPLRGLNAFKAARLALEFNFVNHVFPSGGAAGMSYFAWQLNRYGVRPGRSTMAQIVRFALTFLSFIILLIVALIVLIIDHTVSRNAILLSLMLVVLAVAATIFGIHIISGKKRLNQFAAWLTRVVNKVVRFVTRGKKRVLLREKVLVEFFDDIHDDYIQIRRDKGILLKPFIWSFIANIADVALLFIAFWSFGVYVNPAMLFLAFGLSSIASAASVTPGGAGVYEAVMIAFLASAGVSPDVAIAGTLLARILLMLGTIVFGYVFYQITVSRHGKHPV